MTSAIPNTPPAAETPSVAGGVARFGRGAGFDPNHPYGRSRWRRRRSDIGTMVLQRLAWAIPLLLVVSLGVFGLAALSPFDPLVSYLGGNYTTMGADQRAELATALGLDTPWFTAWWTWLTGAFVGDLGQSRVFALPVTQVIAERLPFTLILSTIGVVIAVVLSLVLGLVAGMRPGTWLDRFITALGVIFQSVPAYVLALAGIVVFALGLGVLPAGGASRPGHDITWAGMAPYLVMPSLVLAASLMPWMLLSVRASVRGALASEPVALARARGLSTRTVWLGHVLPVSLAPLVTLVGVRLPELVVGAVLVEEVFAWPGIAGATVSAASNLDMALLAALTVGTTAVVLFGSLLADVLYLVLDPRVTP